MTHRRDKLQISGQFLHCPLFLSIDTYEGCSFGCRYCFVHPQYVRQHRGGRARLGIRPALLTSWEKALNAKSIGNPMIEYLIRKRHPIQLGTNADPFPREVEKKLQNTRKFLMLCNTVKYPVYITTKNTGELPIDLLADGNYVLGVSLASHRTRDIKLLERNTGPPRGRIAQIPQGVFKRIIVRWQPFIPALYRSKNGRERFDLKEIDRFLDMITNKVDGVSVSYLSWAGIRDPVALQVIGEDDVDEVEALEVFTYMREQAHLRGLGFYTANFRALSDSPICCGLREKDFEMSTPWVWSCLIRKLFDGEKEYLTVEDLKEAFPAELQNVLFVSMNVPLFSRWARYSAKKTTILEEYIRNFTYDRKQNPANYFAGLYSRVENGEFRIYFSDYRSRGS